MDSGVGLTDEQRAHLEEAARNLHSNHHHHKAGEGDHHHSSHPSKPKYNKKNHSTKGTTLNVGPKKGGSGGKGVWGGLMDDGPLKYTDPNDPNYDSDEAPYQLVGAPVKRTLEEFKSIAGTIIEELFTSEDFTSASEDLRELAQPAYHHHFVKRLLTTAMGRKDRERELASALLSALYSTVIPANQIFKGFQRTVESVDDLVLDIPNAVELLALFVARAVVDDVLPPVFIPRAREDLGEAPAPLAAKVLHDADAHLGTRHAAERVLRCWHGGGNRTVEEMKEAIDKGLNEYISGGHVQEALALIRELNVPYFHHELVKRAVLKVLETPAPQQAAISAAIEAFLFEAHKQGLINASQMGKGFVRVVDGLDDMELDIPNVQDIAHDIIRRGQQMGWLSEGFAESAPPPRELTPEEVEFKKKALVIVEEYFTSCDIGETARALLELGQPQHHAFFIKRLVTTAMDRRDREREMAAVLLSSLYGEVLTRAQVAAGFELLLLAAADARLDIPDAAEVLALFLCRAVVDDLLPPAFLTEMLNAAMTRRPLIGDQVLEESALGTDVVRMAAKLLGARHGSERVLRCWQSGGGGAGNGASLARSAEDCKADVISLLEEYLASGDMREACACIRELGMPFFAHEVVKRALNMAVERSAPGVGAGAGATGGGASSSSANEEGGACIGAMTTAPMLLALLKECAAEGIISSSQMEKGLSRFVDGLEDLELDNPGAEAKARSLLTDGKAQGWIPTSFAVPP
eukprot:jgi/Mesvir1/21729/Mv04140-RA.1